MCITILFFLTSKLVLKQGYFATGSKGSKATYQPRKLSGLQSIMAFLSLSALLVIAALPHIGVILMSLSEKWFISLLPNTFTLKAYGELTTHPLVQIGIRNSLGLSALSTILDLILGLTIAWLMVRAKVGRVLLDALTMIPLAVPGIVLAFGYLGMFSQTLLDPRVNPVPLLVIGYAIRRLPFMVRTLHSGLLASSVTLEEAAQNVGASPIETTRFITAPLIMPHIFAGAILCFTFAMLEVSESLILASQEQHFPLTKVMYSLLVRPDGPIIASALGVVSMVLVACALWIASRLTRQRINWAER